MLVLMGGRITGCVRVALNLASKSISNILWWHMKLLFVYTWDDKTFTEGFMVLECKYLRWTSWKLLFHFSNAPSAPPTNFHARYFSSYCCEEMLKPLHTLFAWNYIFLFRQRQTASFNNGSGTLGDNFVGIKNVKVCSQKQESDFTWLSTHSCLNRRKKMRARKRRCREKNC